jgi:hypothetical protein
MNAVASGMKGVSGWNPSMPLASDSAGIVSLLAALMDSPRQHGGDHRHDTLSVEGDGRAKPV